MNFPWLSDPGQSTLMTNITLLVTVSVVARFLFDNLSVTAAGVVLNFGHVDSLTYAAILSPVFAAHSWQHSVNYAKVDSGGEK